MSLDAIPVGARVLIDAKFVLLTNDSLNLAAGLRSGVNLLATADPQFDSVPDLTVFNPDDL